MTSHSDQTPRPVAIYTLFFAEMIDNAIVRWTSDGTSGAAVTAIVEASGTGVCIDVSQTVTPGTERDALALSAINGLAKHIPVDTVSNVAVTTYLDMSTVSPEEAIATDTKSLDALVKANAETVRGFVQVMETQHTSTASDAGMAFVIVAPKIDGITPAHAVFQTSADASEDQRPLVISYVQSKTFDTDTAILQRLNATDITRTLVIVVTPDDVAEWDAAFKRLSRRHARTLFARQWIRVTYPTVNTYLALRERAADAEAM